MAKRRGQVAEAVDIGKLWQDYVRSRDPNLREQLVIYYLPIVKYVAGKMMQTLPSSVDFNDLIGAGVVGLIGALERFDPTVGVKFETFALPRVRGAILDELRMLDWAPRSLRSKARKYEKAAQELEKDLGRSASTKELADRLEVDLQDLGALLRDLNTASLLSLDTSFEDEENGKTGLYEVIRDPLAETPLETIEKEELKRVLVEAINELPEQEKLVLALYYYEELTLKEIGQVLGITESRVSQIHTKAIATLRARLREEVLE
ncbi:MAG: FliA/WhiG family RNA polymerase sigma factor [candidate division KSB1 bacterium]|nr:FliA/WhiG family RNA polymerase sigma factor [candidate division KSB1 bacterium]